MDNIERKIRKLEIAYRDLEEEVRHIRIKIIRDLEERFNNLIRKILERLENESKEVL